MRRIFIKALLLFMTMTVLTGLIYPLAVTGIANLLFSMKARGSLIIRDKVIVGSGLLAQKTDNQFYLWPRPSASDYSTLPSRASNLGPASKVLRDQMDSRRRAWDLKHETDTGVPYELLTASGSGLDPHISPEAAARQLDRIAKNRKWTIKQIEVARRLLGKFTEPPVWGFLGQPRVNILLLNLALDGI